MPRSVSAWAERRAEHERIAAVSQQTHCRRAAHRARSTRQPLTQMTGFHGAQAEAMARIERGLEAYQEGLVNHPRVVGARATFTERAVAWKFSAARSSARPYAQSSPEAQSGTGSITTRSAVERRPRDWSRGRSSGFRAGNGGRAERRRQSRGSNSPA